MHYEKTEIQNHHYLSIHGEHEGTLLDGSTIGYIKTRYKDH